MTLVQLEALLAVIQNKSFTKAAEMMNMTQSAVSQTIHALEAELGVTLVHRNRTGVKATVIGERMVTHAREILFHTRSMREEASASKRQDVGTIQIATIPSAGVSVLPGILGAFRKKFPRVEFVLYEGLEGEVRDWVEGAVVDIGFLPHASDYEFDFTPLITDALYAVFPPEHPLAQLDAITLESLADFPLIASKADRSGWLRNLFRSHELSPTILFEVGECASLITLVQEGLGATVLPKLGIPRVCENVAIRQISPAVCRSIGLGVRSLERVTPATAEFILQAKEYVQSLENNSL